MFCFVRTVNHKMSHGCCHFDTFKEQHVAALILARGGSKGIPQKNLAKINGTTLLKRSITAIHEFGSTYVMLTFPLIFCNKYFSSLCILRWFITGFSSIWVSTDSAHIAKEASMSGAEVHWRSPESATDTAPTVVGVQEFCSCHQGL